MTEHYPAIRFLPKLAFMLFYVVVILLTGTAAYVEIVQASLR